jgi:hypothetical protein
MAPSLADSKGEGYSEEKHGEKACESGSTLGWESDQDAPLKDQPEQ